MATYGRRFGCASVTRNGALTELRRAKTLQLSAAATESRAGSRLGAMERGAIFAVDSRMNLMSVLLT